MTIVFLQTLPCVLCLSHDSFCTPRILLERFNLKRSTGTYRCLWKPFRLGFCHLFFFFFFKNLAKEFKLAGMLTTQILLDALSKLIPQSVYSCPQKRCTSTHLLCVVLEHVPSLNMFQIGMVCCSEKCAFLKHVLDWHCANFVISKPHVKCKVLKHKKL